MRALRIACKKYEISRCKSKNRRAKCVFCPTRGANSLILDCDKIMALRKPGGVTSDCLVIEQHDILHVAVIEFKGGSYSFEHTMSQLVAGANLVMDLLAETGLGGAVRVHLIVVAPRHPSRQRKFLCSATIRVRGRKLSIRTARCGTSFSEIIRSS